MLRGLRRSEWGGTPGCCCCWESRGEAEPAWDDDCWKACWETSGWTWARETHFFFPPVKGEADVEGGIGEAGFEDPWDVDAVPLAGADSLPPSSPNSSAKLTAFFAARIFHGLTLGAGAGMAEAGGPCSCCSAETVADDAHSSPFRAQVDADD